MKLPHPIRFSRIAGFTMVEIALCLAIIGFALIAIIGVLPTGLNVQKDNREETIINQDAAVLMNVIRNGMKGYDDLTNYVVSITNITWVYEMPANSTIPQLASGGMLGGNNPETNVFTYTKHLLNNTPVASKPFLLTNGWHIIGALSRPRIEWVTNNPPSYAGRSFYSNYIVANIRAISGAVAEKYPQTNKDVLDTAFSYRLIVQRDAYVPFDQTNALHASLTGFTDPFDPSLNDIGNGPTGTNNTPVGMTAAERQAYWDQVRANRRIMGIAYTNSQDLRLTFRWPLLPNGSAGNGRQTFRLLVGGNAYRTNDPGQVLPLNLYFLQPGSYAKSL